MPLGRFKAPQAGWLIVSGRRGHYSFCVTTNVYDLATGAAFVHESCSDLHLVQGWDVDRAATDASRIEHVRSGTISIDNLREALLMMLLQEETEKVQINAEWYPLPDGITPEVIARRRGSDAFTFDGATITTAQTILAWRWVPPTGSSLTGEVIWPRSYYAKEDHAAALLDIAELTMVESCVPSRVLTPSVLGRPAMRVHALDAPPDVDFPRKVAAAYEQWRRAPLCQRSPGDRERRCRFFGLKNSAGLIIRILALMSLVASSGLSFTAARTARNSGGNGVNLAAAMFS